MTRHIITNINVVFLEQIDLKHTVFKILFSLFAFSFFLRYSLPACAGQGARDYASSIEPAPGEAVLEYSLGENASHLTFITQGAVEEHELPPRSEIEKKVGVFRTNLTDRNSWKNVLGMLAYELYKVLIEPVESGLAGVERLIVVPDGRLHTLPFEALRMWGDGSALYLIERFDIRYAPGLDAASVVERRRRERGGARGIYRGWAGFGDPVYGRSDGRAEGKGISKATARMRDSYTLDLSGGGGDPVGFWKRNPKTGTEIDAISKTFRKGGAGANYITAAGVERAALSKLFNLDSGGGAINYGLNASEQRFKALAAEGHRYIHVASGGILDGGRPAVVLSLVGNAGTGEDGFLTAAEVRDMNIAADMVVLNLRNVDRLKKEEGNGRAAMVHAFLHAGAGSLVMNLWDADDDRHRDLVVGFYRKLKAGADGGAALREAKLEMFERNPHPYYWAPFVFIGAN